MYFGPSPLFTGGHGSAGVTAPATSWFLAEGATGSYFSTFVLLANPGTTTANVSVTYLLPDGTVTKIYDVAPTSRRTISVDDESSLLANTPVSMVVTSTNGQPIIAERAMWWPSPNWYEAHLSVGTTTTGTRWGLADGEVGSSNGEAYETYILIANTGTSDGSATP